jgi:hypothetical protein
MERLRYKAGIPITKKENKGTVIIEGLKSNVEI